MYCLNVYMHTLPMLFFMLQAKFLCACVCLCFILYAPRVCMIITVTCCCSEHSISAIPERAMPLRYYIDRGGDFVTRVQTLIELCRLSVCIIISFVCLFVYSKLCFYYLLVVYV